MNRKYFIPIIGLLMAGCTAIQDPASEKEPAAAEPMREDAIVSKVNGATYYKAGLNAGRLIVKFNEPVAREIEACDADVAVLSQATKSGLAAPLSKFTPVKMERLFEHAGEFEPRTVAAGLDRWYVMEFAEDVDMTDLEKAFADVEAVEAVEFDLKIRLMDDGDVVYVPFDDPRLSDQWHYYNDGSRSGASEGSDINVYPVWESYAAGSSDVIVAVIDEGVQGDHPDLAANMWTDPNTGLHGRNFTGGSSIQPGDHGTHVAGTIAAVNNNGIGVSGIAGGDAATGMPGVQIMSCQIFGYDSSGSGATAIKWAADNGAIIAQNSWGYVVDLDEDGRISSSELSYAASMTIGQSLREAIDYFIQYAGCDNNGDQLPDSPMKGGVVLFSAGNDNIQYGPPANCYAPIIAVAAIGADYQKAYYSCYGDWVDICAPGGDSAKGFDILSTTTNSTYGYMQGTSMACPHASGVAALVIANMGGQGFTCAELEEILVSTARTEEIETANTRSIGPLVSAADAVTSGREVQHTIRAEGSSQITMRMSQTRSINFRVNNPTGHALRLSIEPEMPGVTASMVEGSNGRTIAVNIDGRVAAQGRYDVSHQLSGSIVVACDLEPDVTHSATFSVSIDANNAPMLLREINGLVIDRLGESVRISLGTYFFDGDGDELYYEITDTDLGRFTVNGAQVTFNASSYGTDEVTVTARDPFDATISQVVPILVRDGSRNFDVYPNPVRDYMNIRASEAATVSVEIYSESGALVVDESVAISPFEPGRMDLSGLDAGLYTVNISGNGLRQTTRISKI